MTHFADADTSRGVAEQLRRFEAAVGRDRRAAQPRELRGDRCAIRRRTPTGCGPASCSTAARRLPTSPRTALGLQPAMTLSSRAHRRARRCGRAMRVGYGGDVRRRPAAAHRRRRLRLCRRLSAPRADRHAGARGRRAHATVGRVSMDMLYRRPRSGPGRARRHAGDALGRGHVRATRSRRRRERWLRAPVRARARACRQVERG